MYISKDSLNGKWKLFIAENREYIRLNRELDTERELDASGFLKIDGSVPGNFELDMQSAGLIGDPFFGTNPLEIQKLENRHLWYTRRFSFNGDPQNAYLIFEGIDTFSEIYLNGAMIGRSDNMLIPHEFKAEGIKQGENEIVVHIKPVCIEARKFEMDMDVSVHQKYNAGSLAVRKAAHSFGWDIMPRFISGGIWRDCFIVEKKKDYIEDIYLYTFKISGNKAKICGCFDTRLEGDFSTDYSLKIKGVCGESSFGFSLDKLWHNKGAFEFVIEDPALWHVRDMGEQNLYDVTVGLWRGDRLVDTKRFNFGVRTIKLLRSDVTDKNGNGEFCFVVNDVRTFIRGTNWVPLDAFHSRDNERLSKALDMLLDINCNAVRCWGGNVYEDHAFFDFCDKHGILVWQDFAMGCATYPQNEEFLSAIGEELGVIVKKLRQHPSIALWAGDNECDEATAYWRTAKKDPNKNRITREIIPNILARFDPYREYLPSSPYVSEEAYKCCNHDCLPESHLWGPRDYFKGDYYAKSSAHFASETGYHGCPSPESLKKFISPDKLWPWQNDEWHVHQTCMELGEGAAYSFRNKLMSNQIQVLFGTVPDNLEEFSRASQFSQGEAVKFFIERFRTGKWRRTGIIWWNLLDGWPQISDAVVDYYFVKKVAYSYIKRSQEPVCIMLREPDNGRLDIVIANEYQAEKHVQFTVTDIESSQCATSGAASVKANGLITVGSIPYETDRNRYYLLELVCDGKKVVNHYVSGKTPYSLDEYKTLLSKAGIIS